MNQSAQQKAFNIEGQIELPCNITFSYTKTPVGFLVSLSGFTAGPPATINSPQILVADYNPAACFNGPSLGGMYLAHMIAFLDTSSLKHTIKLRGWVSDLSTSKGQCIEVSKDIALSERP